MFSISRYQNAGRARGKKGAYERTHVKYNCRLSIARSNSPCDFKRSKRSREMAASHPNHLLLASIRLFVITFPLTTRLKSSSPRLWEIPSFEKNTPIPVYLHCTMEKKERNQLENSIRHDIWNFELEEKTFRIVDNVRLDLNRFGWEKKKRDPIHDSWDSVSSDIANERPRASVSANRAKF